MSEQQPEPPAEPKEPTIEDRVNKIEAVVSELPRAIQTMLQKYDADLNVKIDAKLNKLLDTIIEQATANKQTQLANPTAANQTSGGIGWVKDIFDMAKSFGLTGSEDTDMSIPGINELLKERHKLELLGYKQYVQKLNADFARRMGIQLPVEHIANEALHQ